MEISDIKVGQRVEFWSERVFGVPAHGTVTKVGRKLVHVDAWYGGAEWSTRIAVSRIVAVESR
jgi:hypothetical protein